MDRRPHEQPRSLRAGHAGTDMASPGGPPVTTPSVAPHSGGGPRVADGNGAGHPCDSSSKPVLSAIGLPAPLVPPGGGDVRLVAAHCADENAAQDINQGTRTGIAQGSEGSSHFLGDPFGGPREPSQNSAGAISQPHRGSKVGSCGAKGGLAQGSQGFNHNFPESPTGAPRKPWQNFSRAVSQPHCGVERPAATGSTIPAARYMRDPSPTSKIPRRGPHGGEKNELEVKGHRPNIHDDEGRISDDKRTHIVDENGPHEKGPTHAELLAF